MTRRDFEIRAAEFFLCCNNVEEQYDKLNELEGYIYPNGIDDIVVWEAFVEYDVSQLLKFISELANNYEEFYKMNP